MLKKIQSYFNIVLVLFAIFGIGYFIFSVIKNKITVPERMTSKTIVESLTKENLVKSNQTFNNLDKCLSNFIEACVSEKYDELYDIMISNYKKIYSKSEAKKIFEEYKNNFLTSNDAEEYTDLEGNLINAYKSDNGGYILVVENKTKSNMYLYVIFDDYLGTYNYALIDR